MLTLLICFMTLGIVSAHSEHRLTDYFEAAWFDGMVKIPLTIDDSLWVADMYSFYPDTDTIQDGGVCILDNNSAASVIFSRWITGDEDNWFEGYSNVNTCADDKEETILEDGYVFKTYECRQKLCIGSLIDGLQLDPHTSVCNVDQTFYFATAVD